jgi:YHS domain-containing protein
MSIFRSVLGVVPAAIVLLAVAGCPEQPPVWQSPEAKVLGVDSETALDPVSGRLVGKNDAIKREYRGAIYYFESVENASIFDRDPRLYAVIENVPPADHADVK